MEVWKQVLNFEGLYEISNLGNIRNSRGRTLKQFDRNGYKRIELWKDKTKFRKSVHVLVAEVFLSNDENKPFVTHKDGDASNNNVNNLQWISPEEKRVYKKLTDKEVGIIRNIYIPGDAEFGAKALADKFRVHRNSIYLIASGKTRKTSDREAN